MIDGVEEAVNDITDVTEMVPDYVFDIPAATPTAEAALAPYSDDH